ncbi:hypothetical protein [Chitinophaga vietnamensis]|nr:hypothetical protein [Chitinophaga vietnamensis]
MTGVIIDGVRYEQGGLSKLEDIPSGRIKTLITPNSLALVRRYFTRKSIRFVLIATTTR